MSHGQQTAALRGVIGQLKVQRDRVEDAKNVVIGSDEAAGDAIHDAWLQLDVAIDQLIEATDFVSQR